MPSRFEKKTISDPSRVITVLDTVNAIVPPESQRFLSHKVDRVRFPNGNEGYHHRLIIPEGIMVAHVDENDLLALVDNYRHPIGRYSRELPSGGLDPNETAEFENASPELREEILMAAAIREMREETGRLLTRRDITRLFPGPLQGSVGFADQTYHIYHGQGGTMIGQKLDDGEQGMLTVDRYAIDDAAEMISNEIVDPATATAVMALAGMYGKRVPCLEAIRKNRTIIL
jgi:ADP-ribose pyrophosphatase